MKKTLLLLFIQLISLHIVWSKDHLNYSFLQISGEDGLSQSNVKAIVQDSYGFMWFGTKNGLNRYDGTSIHQLNCKDIVLGKGNNNISALFEDKHQTLWVGTDRGVYLYHIISDTFTLMDMSTEEGFKMQNWVGGIVSDSRNIWVLIPDQGVFRYVNNKLHYYRLIEGDKVKSQFLSSIYVDGEDNVWVTTWGRGLLKYEPTKDQFVQYAADKHGRSLLNMPLSGICRKEDSLILGVHDGKVLKYNLSANELKDMDALDVSHTFVRNVNYYNGEIWVGTHDGAFILNREENKVTHLREDLINPFSLSNKIVYTTYVDRDGGIWIGTMFGGVNYLSNHDMSFDKFVPGTSAQSLRTKLVREMVEDNDGNIWIGSEDCGVSVLDTSTGTVRQIQYSKSTGSNHLATLGMAYYDNKVYCGLFKQGIDVLNKQGKVTHYTPSEVNLGEGGVYSYYVDKKGNHWMGTDFGLYKSDGKPSDFVKVAYTGYDWIFDILEEKDGTLWFATMGTGVWKHDPATNSYKKYESVENDTTGISSNSVSSIMQDSKGAIWLSTDRGGICKYNKEKDNFTTYSTKDGLPDDVAYEILEDDNHFLWFGTNKGLVKFDPGTKEVQVFTVKDGLLGNQFNYKSAVKAKNGKFYFGGIDGLIAFNPNVEDKDRKTPAIYISDMRIYNERVTVHTPNSPLQKHIIATDQITLSHDQSNISFDISLLNYSMTHSNQYYYCLEPIDKHWIRSPKGQSVSYAKLAPGKYTLKVSAAGDPTKDTTSVDSLHILILPPWYASDWAYLLYTIGFIGVTCGWFLWYRRRKEIQMEERQQLFAIQKEKELYESKVEFFTEIAHEVRTPLTLINGPLEVIQEMNITDVRLTRNLHVIAQNTKRLLNLASQLLDFQKIGANRFVPLIESVDIVTLLKETIDRFEPTIVHNQKTIRTHIPETDIIAAVDKEAIIKILSNLLNNALKYARQAIRVSLSVEESCFIVCVESDGDKILASDSEAIFEPFYRIGKVNSETAGVGIGLPLSRSLASLHGGKLYLDTGKENNSFVLEIPLNKEMIRKQTEIIVQNVIELTEISTEEEMKGYTLLLVEDNEAMQEFMTRRLQELFTVIATGNGKEALHVLRNQHVDLVVSDVMMPVMDGWELCKVMKADIDLCTIPVIFLTAKNDLESKIKGLKVGAEAYVEKPFSFNHLKTQILSLLSNRQKERETFLRRPFFPVNSMQMNKADEEFMNKVIGIINENLTDENFNVERMADVLCMSRSSLLRKIKMLFNLSPIDFIRLIRLKKAAELIQTGQYRIGEIGFMVGFNSPSYFGKLFLKQFGVLPKDFEKQSQNRKGAINIDDYIHPNN